MSVRAMTRKPSCLIAAEDKPGKASAGAATQMFALLCYSCGRQFPSEPPMAPLKRDPIETLEGERAHLCNHELELQAELEGARADIQQAGENQRTFLAAGEDSPDLLATVSATLQKAERRARDAADALAITVGQRKVVERKLAEAKTGPRADTQS
jgi:hypothetical protein